MILVYRPFTDRRVLTHLMRRLGDLFSICVDSRLWKAIRIGRIRM
jgi:hypothetical protein